MFARVYFFRAPWPTQPKLSELMRISLLFVRCLHLQLIIVKNLIIFLHTLLHIMPKSINNSPLFVCFFGGHLHLRVWLSVNVKQSIRPGIVGCPHIYIYMYIYIYIGFKYADKEILICLCVYIYIYVFHLCPMPSGQAVKLD